MASVSSDVSEGKANQVQTPSDTEMDDNGVVDVVKNWYLPSGMDFIEPSAFDSIEADNRMLLESEP